MQLRKDADVETFPDNLFREFLQTQAPDGAEDDVCLCPMLLYEAFGIVQIRPVADHELELVLGRQEIQVGQSHPVLHTGGRTLDVHADYDVRVVGDGRDVRRTVSLQHRGLPGGAEHLQQLRRLGLFHRLPAGETDVADVAYHPDDAFQGVILAGTGVVRETGVAPSAPQTAPRGPDEIRRDADLHPFPLKGEERLDQSHLAPSS